MVPRAAQVSIRLLGRFGLLAGGEPVALPTRKAQALLAFLARSPGVPAARARLSGLLWPDRPDAQGRASLRQALASIRRAFEPFDLPGPQTQGDEVVLDPAGLEVDLAAVERLLSGGDLRRAIEQYRGPFLEGFPPVVDLFDDWVQAQRSALAARVADARRTQVSRSRRGPSLAVMPFEVLVDGGEAATFARGFAEDVCVELARFRTLEVIAHDSAVRAAADEPDAAAAGRALSADYLLTGSVRAGQGRLRVAARLSESTTARQVWAGRHDAELADVFAVQDRIAQEVANALALCIDDHELLRSRQRPPERLDAYQCWVKGMAHLRTGRPEGDREARALFLRALELDPSSARAHAGLSLAHFNDWSCSAWERWDDNEAGAYRHAVEAVRLDPHDHVPHLILGRILIYRREFDLGAVHLDRALVLNGSDADGLAHAALGQAYLGDPGRGLALAAEARRLHPFHPAWYQAVAALDHFFAGDVREAARLFELASDAFVDVRAFLAAAYARAGRLDEARENAERFLARYRSSIAPFGPPMDPVDWLLRVNPFRREGDRAVLLEGLERAGLARSGCGELAREGLGPPG